MGFRAFGLFQILKFELMDDDDDDDFHTLGKKF